MGSYVGIDLHRRRSVMVVLNDDGEGCRRLGSTTRRRIWPARSSPPAARCRGGDGSDVGLVLGGGCDRRVRGPVASGASVGDRRLCEPAGEERHRDATLLADLLRLGRLPEAWVAPPEVRQLREVVRYRAKLPGCGPG